MEACHMNASGDPRNDGMEGLLLNERTPDGPDDHRQSNAYKPKDLNVSKATFLVVGGTIGTGLVAVPHALQGAGWTGLVLIAVGILSWGYCSVILGRCWTIVQERYPEARTKTRRPYPMIAEKALGFVAGVLMTLSICVSNVGGSMVIILLTGQNLESLSSAAGFSMSQCYWFVIFCVIMIPFTWLDTPKDFWLCGVLGCLTIAGTFVVLMTALIQKMVDGEKGVEVTNPSAHGVFLALGNIVYALGGTPYYPTIQCDMAEPEKFKQAVVYASIGFFLFLNVPPFFGYYIYGRDLEANILMNLPNGWLRITSELLLTTHFVTAFLIILNPVMQVVEGVTGLREEFTWRRCLLRSGVLLCILFVVETVPRVGPIMDLIGGSTLSFAVFGPSVFYLSLCSQKGPWTDRSLPLHVKVLCIEIAIVGVFIAIVATYSATLEIVSVKSKTFVPPCYIKPLKGSQD